jgi:hypothetical protein
MRVITLLIVSVGFLAVAGCSSNNKGKIEGTKWTNEAGTIKGSNIPAGVIVLEFGKDGKLSFGGGLQVLTGTYSLKSGDTVTFHFDKEHNGRKDHDEKISISGDRLTLTDSDGTLTFKKAN